MKENDATKPMIRREFPDLIPSELVGCKPMGTKEDLIFALNYHKNNFPNITHDKIIDLNCEKDDDEEG